MKLERKKKLKKITKADISSNSAVHIEILQFCIYNWLFIMFVYMHFAFYFNQETLTKEREKKYKDTSGIQNRELRGLN